MGQAKHQMMMDEERGWSSPETFVCADCIYDPYLKCLIVENLEASSCDYCEARGYGDDIAAPIEVILGPIASAVFYRFSSPSDANVPWDEGQYTVRTQCTDDVLMELSLDVHDDVFVAISTSFQNWDWVPTAGGHWASSHRNRVLTYSWNSFAETVKHRTRFYFQNSANSEQGNPEEIDDGDVLPVIGSIINSMHLAKNLPPETLLYRCRIRERNANWQIDADELGAPPPGKARAGRMNPAGIAYLYTAFEAPTALAEVVLSPPLDAVLATFTLTRPLLIVDLTNLFELPSIFDSEAREVRESLLFLQNFTEQISEPISKEGQEHIDYVPTQVLCEYLAQVFLAESWDNTKVDGIAYPSAIKPGGKNLVLFPRYRFHHLLFDAVEYQSSEVMKIRNWDDLTRHMLPK